MKHHLFIGTGIWDYHASSAKPP